MSIEDQVNDSISNPGKYTTADSGGVPVGTVLSVYYPNGKFTLPQNWCVCDGQPITDPESPYVNLNAPNLLDGRFPMGTKYEQTFGRLGGSNSIPANAPHTHQYSIRKTRNASRSPAGFQSEGDECETETFDTTPSGAHDHGGDNRPQWFGLLYIFKYK
jgi:hypothetical protein